MKASRRTCFLFFAISLSGCAGDAPVTAVPESLLTETEVTVFDGATNGDLVEYVIELKESVRLCNADKAAVREILKGDE